MARPAQAADIFVNPGESIQAAIDAASPGDTLIISAGTYTESLTLSKAVSLTGVSSATTILVAEPGQRVLTVTGSTIDNSVVISGLLFTGGVLTDVYGFYGCPVECGGGILLTNNAQPLFHSITIYNNMVDRAGGGLHAEAGSDVRLLASKIVSNTGGGLSVVDRLILQDTTVQDNLSGHDGGGAYAGEAEILDSVFEDNRNQCSTSCGGGGLWAEDAVVINSRFENNRGGTGNGGGLFGYTVTISNSQFISNVSDGGGGGLFGFIETRVDDSYFEGNEALVGGGIVGHINMVISGTTLLRNTAVYSGGSAYNSVLATITNNLFKDNVSGADGGGLMVGVPPSTPTVQMKGNSFINNYAAGKGGGAYVIAYEESVLPSLRMVSDSFIGNSAGDKGGGLRVNGTAHITGATFINNSSATVGGGLYLTGTTDYSGLLWRPGTLTLSDTTIISNTAASHGGGIFVSDVATVTNSLVEANHSGDSGGGLYAAGRLLLQGTTIQDNESGRDGGGIYAGEAEILDSIFENNWVQYSSGDCDWYWYPNGDCPRGGGLYASDEAVVVDSLFEKNRCDSYCHGGGLAGSTVTISNSEFISNVSFPFAGGVFALDLTVDDSYFEGNQAAHGGAILGDGNTVISGTTFARNEYIGVINGYQTTITNSLFKDNLGGGLLAGVTSTTTVQLKGNRFINNSTTGRGGGVNIERSGSDTSLSDAIKIEGDRFIGNSAEGKGGGLYVEGAAQIHGATFLSNTAASDGGAISAWEITSMTHSLVEANHSGDDGGGIYIEIQSLRGVWPSQKNSSDLSGINADDADIFDSPFEMNRTACSSAGCVSDGLSVTDSTDDREGTLTLADTTILSNTAAWFGGGIYARGPLTITHSHFEANHSDEYGGGVDAYELTLADSTFINNNAGFAGGGVGTLHLTSTHNTFINNSAQIGGGLISGGMASISNSTFISNTAETWAGAIAYDADGGKPSAFRLVNSLLVNNSAGEEGSALFLLGPGSSPYENQIIHSTIVGRQLNGTSAIYAISGTLTVTNSIITSHTIDIENEGGLISEDYNLYSGISTHFSGTLASGGHSLFDVDPGFVDPANRDYHLRSDSAAVDTGVDAGISVDIDGDPRPMGDGFDMGADEYLSPPPLAPTLYMPLVAVFTHTVTFSWSEVSDAVDYRLLVIRDGIGPIHNQWYLAGNICSAGVCSVTPPAPLPLDGYTWYVRARNAAGSADSPAGWFYITDEVPPPAPNLRQPTGTLADNQPTYRWDHVGGAVEYQLLVVGADSLQYANTWYQALDICTSSLCEVPQASPLPEQGYSWYVRARNPYGFNWSPGKLFSVFFGVRPVAPTQLEPIGLISDTTPAYTWSDEGDAYDYMLLVVDSQRNRELHSWYLAADICDGSTCTVVQPTPLPEDNYNWYLKARNPAGARWAAGQRFTIFSGGLVGQATPITPTGTINSATPTYTWTEAADAVDYQLLVFDGSGSLLMTAWYLASDICSASTCAATPALVLAEADYFWQVKSRNPLGAAYSSKLYFTVDQG